MKRILNAIILMGCVLLTAACSQEPQHSVGTAESAAPEARSSDAMLAYEHRLRIEVSGGEPARRMASVQEACVTARFGPCHILNIWQNNEYSASLTVRAAPESASQLIALASGEGGKVASRKTHAEDLARAVSDNRGKIAQLTSYAERMEALAKKPGIAVADLITLAGEQAKVWQELETLRQTAANHQQRIDTHLIEINFFEKGSDADSSFSLLRNLPNLGERFSRGIYDMLSVLMYGFPFLVLLFFVVLLWRLAWRRIFRKKESAAQ